MPDPSWPSILDLAIKLWGEPTEWSHNKNEARFGAKQSKAVKIREAVWKDHEPPGQGGGYKALWALAHPGQSLPPRTDGKGQKANGADNGKVKPWDDIGVIYPYPGADGTLILQVIRTLSRKPRFRQRRPNGYRMNGEIKWKWTVSDLPGHDCLLYRLPELLAADPDRFVFVCEGEKDADNLAATGLIATTNIGGASKWRPEYGVHFTGRHVVVLPDNDPPGRDHAATVARSLHDVAASVRILELPGLPPKGDASDWLAAGGAVEELERLARDTPLYVPPPPREDAPGSDAEPPEGWDTDVPPERPVINCRAGELPRMIQEAQAALVKTGAALYQRGMLVQPTESEYTAADGSVTHSCSDLQTHPYAWDRNHRRLVRRLNVTADDSTPARESLHLSSRLSATRIKIVRSRAHGQNNLAGGKTVFFFAPGVWFPKMT